MKTRLRHTGAIALLLLLAACGSTPTARFYTLSSLAGSGGAERSPAGHPRTVVGIGPVAMARYLDHPGITVRSGPNTVTRSELDRWGGGLGDDVSRVLVENLGQLLPGDEYQVLPWLETAAVDCRVQFNVTRFEGTADGPVVLNAGWMLFGGERHTLLASGDAAITEPLRGEGYAATVQAMSRALAELSRHIVVRIRAVGGGRQYPAAPPHESGPP